MTKDWLVVKEEWIEGSKEAAGFQMVNVVFSGTLDECAARVQSEDDSDVWDYTGNSTIHFYIHKDEAKLRGYS